MFVFFNSEKIMNARISEGKQIKKDKARHTKRGKNLILISFEERKKGYEKVRTCQCKINEKVVFDSIYDEYLFAFFFICSFFFRTRLSASPGFSIEEKVHGLSSAVGTNFAKSAKNQQEEEQHESC